MPPQPVTRLEFWRGALAHGWRWAAGLFEHVGRALTLLAVFGVPFGGLAALGASWWGALAGAVALAVLICAEGAFRMWANLEGEQRMDRAVAESENRFALACFRWIDEVETFLDAREAKQPFGPRGGLSDLIANPESGEEREAREEYGRETVSLYIERHRAQGILLFEGLVGLRLLVDKGAPTVQAPRSVYQIKEAVDIVRAGAERLKRV